MSEPISNSEIEDVLSSIRRLVSDDPITRQTQDKPAAGGAQVERLVLTPAFRVDDSQDDTPAEDHDAPIGDRAPSLDLAPDIEPEDTADAAPMIEAEPEPDPEPEMLAFRHIERTGAPEAETDTPTESELAPPLPEGFEATDAWSDDSLKLHQTEEPPQAEQQPEQPQPDEAAAELGAVLTDPPNDETFELRDVLPPPAKAADPAPGEGKRPANLSLEDRIAELEAAIGHQPTQDWEPDGSEDGTDDETRPLSADVAEIKDVEAVLELTADVSPYPLDPLDGDWAEPAATAEAIPEAGTVQPEESPESVGDEDILHLASAIAAATSVETRKAEREDQQASSEALQVEPSFETPEETLDDLPLEGTFDDSAIADLMGQDDAIEVLEPEAEPPVAETDAEPDTRDDGAQANVIELEQPSDETPPPVEDLAEFTPPEPEPEPEHQPEPEALQDPEPEAVTPGDIADAWNEMESSNETADDGLRIVSPSAAPEVEWHDFNAQDEIAASASAEAAEELAETEDDFFDTDDNGSDTILDEDALRELVSNMIREELQGVLGERITRNVRRLVRREIQRALAVRDLE